MRENLRTPRSRRTPVGEPHRPLLRPARLRPMSTSIRQVGRPWRPTGSGTGVPPDQFHARRGRIAARTAPRKRRPAASPSCTARSRPGRDDFVMTKAFDVADRDLVVVRGVGTRAGAARRPRPRASAGSSGRACNPLIPVALPGPGDPRGRPEGQGHRGARNELCRPVGRRNPEAGGLPGDDPPGEPLQRDDHTPGGDRR